MILFIILKLTGHLTLSWWWIIAGAFGTIIPFALTIMFIICKCTHVLDISWWWIILTIALDFFEVSTFPSGD